VTRTAIKFGIFVVVCLFFTAYLAFTIGNIDIDDPLGRNYYSVSATFDDVTGLLPLDNVKVAGVVVGKVRSIKVEQGRARVTFDIQDDYKVPSDSSVQIRWRNLIGQRYLYINPGTSTTALQAGAKITDPCTGSRTTSCTTSVVDLGELFNRLGPIVQNIDPKQVNDFMETVSQALDGNTDKLSKAIDDLAVLAKALGDRDQTIGRLVQNLNTVAGTVASRDQQIRLMLDNLVLISQTFSANTQTLDAALNETGRFSTNLRSVLDGNAAELDRIISNLAIVSTETVAPKLQTLSSALAGLDVTASRIFGSSNLGEWLNQDILCAGVGPPTAGLPGTCTGLGPILGGPGSPGLPTSAPAADTGAAGPPTTIGSSAPSNAAGASALQQLLKGLLP
jgi:phospholipid/cholesterol/gamma-HCH transport system substrate-binding protein